ncbi:MAG TPA: acyl-CoA dehydrogenase [Saprospiraceae bacterium]|nr:acyl-CoA dehydrogenase [Saprospiraceae bacterium]HMQ85747.1 acyl-CoA dehydrogenase [Saprospiraceae bacterium]
MAAYTNMDTICFQLFQVHDLERILQLPRFSDYDANSVLLFLDSVKAFSDKELFPYIKEMDEHPARYEEGRILVHPQFESILKQGSELGLVGTGFDYALGGLQLPAVLFHTAYYIMEAANNHVPGYMGLTSGAANLIATFGSQALIDTYLPNMLAMKWGGTMCLTEPQAGSSISDLVTTALPQADGSYKLKGQKIFISSGDHQFAENFVHLVLARIDGAPAGTKGISLFVVPKFRPSEGDSLEYNDVFTAGEFQKLGQRGYCTTHLVFGENDNCQAWLVGQPNQGLSYMFQLMNEARIATGRAGAAIASAAYYASLQYANERSQGRRLEAGGKKDLSEEQILIIHHPDVRRMLLLQKAVVEGSLSLVIQASIYADLAHAAEDASERSKYHLLLELLTPMTKTYPGEMGRISVSNGLQVLGGYGFCTDFILQQYYRDIRIIAIYEGTTGIQSIDLLGRKVMMENGKALKLLAAEINATIQDALTFVELQASANALGEKLVLIQEVMAFLSPFALKGEYERFLADATLFMEFLSNIVVAWQWLKMAVAAKQALVSGKLDYSEDFYESKIHTMKFYYKYELPKTEALAKSMQQEEALTLAEEKVLF